MKDSTFYQVEGRISEIGLNLEREDMVDMIDALDSGYIMLAKAGEAKIEVWMIGVEKP